MHSPHRIVRVRIDEAMSLNRSPEAEHERAVASLDLVEDNRFRLKAGIDGPYLLRVSAADQRLLFDVGPEPDGTSVRIPVALAPLRSVIRDYYLMCDSYHDAIKQAAPSRIEAIDMGRRGLHNEGSLMLMEQIEPHAETDLETVRRFFTFICVLRLK